MAKKSFATGKPPAAKEKIAAGEKLQSMETLQSREKLAAKEKIAANKKLVYLFGEIKNANSQGTIFLLGNKGAQLAEMTSIGLPVPPGFCITTSACNSYIKSKSLPPSLMAEVKAALAKIEKKMDKSFGSSTNPLFFSVRSGSYVSMPGMMDTVLNLGMNDETASALAEQTKNPRMAYDSYRRFIQMFGDVVMKVPHSAFESALHRMKETKGVEHDTGLDADDLKNLVAEYKSIVQSNAGKHFPTDAFEQLQMSIEAVFLSWNNPRAIAYRRINSLRQDAGTGVTVQVMVFGNMGNTSGTGVGFTRNPSTGSKEHYGEYLVNAQGEDVVAGIRTPKHIDKMKKDLPQAYAELAKIYSLLDSHYKDMQDFEFTIENNKLYLLQTRSGKRTAKAAVKIAVDMVNEKLITKQEALLRIKPEHLDQLLHKQLDGLAKRESELLARGLPASPGAAVGKLIFNAENAKELKEKDACERLILARAETSPEDIEGMHAAQGILTSTGGLTSHAAVVARGMGKCAVVGCNDISINELQKTMAMKTKSGEILLNEGDFVSLDGSTGEIFKGQLPLVEPSMSKDFATILQWADSERVLKVMANADTPHDAKIARSFGAEGIGLCRTEHMFFEGERIKAVREMILAETKAEREKSLAKLLPMQKSDFIGIFEEMKNLPVTIRLLDPPLHEFLPKEDKEIKELALSMNIPEERLRAKISSLHELNPMLGFRGCRLGIVYPEITEMQVKAIFEAAAELHKKGIKPKPEIMIPVLGHVNEMKDMKALVDRVAKEVMQSSSAKIGYSLGVMMELPRACLTADEIAEYAEFFSFGTNDLTQTAFGYSRDDAGKFIPAYIEKGILKHDPFQVLDQDGVGKLVEIAVKSGRAKRKDLKIGICGEHGGEAESIAFCHKAGLNYVSCSPYRVPIARLAAAQAALRENKK